MPVCGSWVAVENPLLLSLLWQKRKICIIQHIDARINIRRQGFTGFKKVSKATEKRLCYQEFQTWPSRQMLFDGIFESFVNPPAAPISLAAMGAPRMTETFGAMKAILDSTYLRFINQV